MRGFLHRGHRATGARDEISRERKPEGATEHISVWGERVETVDQISILAVVAPILGGWQNSRRRKGHILRNPHTDAVISADCVHDKLWRIGHN